MPYVNIPDSNLGGVASAQIGKIQGVVLSKVLDKASKLVNKLKEDGCPNTAGTRDLRNKLNQINNLISGIDGKLSKFRRLPNKLRRPVRGLKAALNIILILPIPQAVPPGFGIPVSITTKYADLLHMIKELIKQADELIEAINTALQTPDGGLKSLQRLLSQADSAIRACELENALKDELAKGNITQKELEDLGLFDDGFITSDLGPRLLSDADDSNYRGIWTANGNQFYYVDDRVKYKISNETEYSIWICTKDHKSGPDTYPGKGPWRRLDQAIKDSLEKLNQSLNSIDNSGIKDNLKNVLDGFKEEESNTDDNDFYYTSNSGIVYQLEIVIDPTSPSIAPRRFAVAKNEEGVIVLKGQPSFSSSVKVLLDEIKFRIDNQLP